MARLHAYTFAPHQLDDFKRTWPCHNIPDRVTGITYEFEPNGDLVDVAYHGEPGWVSLTDHEAHDAGPALVALAADAWAALVNAHHPDL